MRRLALILPIVVAVPASTAARAQSIHVAAAIGFATIPPSDPGGLSIAALNRMIVAAVKGVQKRGSHAGDNR